MDDKLTTIYTAANSIQARLLKNVLDEEGIQAFLVNEQLHVAAGGMTLGGDAAVRVAVLPEHAAEARSIAVEFESQLIHEPANSSGLGVGNAVTTLWPDCPDCGRPRTAVCPWCGTAGTRFPAADTGPANDGDQEQTERWICPTCDEPVEDRFLRCCEWCNQDFGNGIQAKSAGIRAADYEPNRRIIFVFLALIGLVALLITYFSIVLAR